MERTINILCKNNGETIEMPLGSTVFEAYEALGVKMEHGAACAEVNNTVRSLNYVLFSNCDVKFLDITSPSGMRTYTRSLFFILCKAAGDLFPGVSVRIDTPVSNGYYCRIIKNEEITEKEVAELEKRMREIVSADIPFRKIKAHTADVAKRFREAGMESKAKLIESTGSLYSCYYMLGDTLDYYYGALLRSTGSVWLFGIEKYHDGVLLRLPDASNPSQLKAKTKQEKMFGVFNENHQWQGIMGLNTIGDLNEMLSKGLENLAINVSEALQEKKISNIAEQIAKHKEVKVVLISGPSSSGKTTFSVYALNIPLLSHDLENLIAGNEVELPRYNFHTGKSEKSGVHLKVDNNMILVIEGIHALNPELTKQINEKNKFRVYVSALTSILLDDHNYIPTTDNRLLRRIVRDYKYRGYSAQETIRRWSSVRAGEEKWIFPYQENADVMFNSALLFELAALKNQALPLLQQVGENEEEHSEAHRLAKFLSYIKPIPIEGLPPTSLLREFLGGSTFHY